MHTHPVVYHRDIRKPNIMRHYNGQGWFLIDWMDASTNPTHAATHLTLSEHSSCVHEEHHGPEVDVWGAGKYMHEVADRVGCKVAKPVAVKQMARRWMEDTSMSAASALAEIEVGIYHLNIRVIY